MAEEKKKEEKTDSVSATEDRHARLKAESARLAAEEAKAEVDREEQQAVRGLKADKAEIKHLEQQVDLLSPGGTRDELLERIRRLRDDVPQGPPVPPPLSDFMRKQMEIEHQAGREAVKRAEEQMEQAKATREAAAVEEKARLGTMQTVHHANPGMNEQFPAQNATLGKKK